MCTFKKIILIILISIIPHILMAAGLKEYLPKNADEKSIIELLTSYEEARSNNDKVRFLSYLHDDGQFMLIEDHAYYPKLAINTIWPKIFEHHQTEILSTPEIRIEEDKAEVHVSVEDEKGHKWKATFQVVREDGRWLIHRYTWHKN